MMSVVDSKVDRRTHKKLMTYRSLASAARELTLERGLEDVTIEEITDAAGVSPRTFFNYFSCKEEAIVGVEPALLREIAREVESRPANEDPFAALLAVLAADEDSELARRWMIRTELTTRYPQLIPRHMAAVVELERELTDAIATRIGTDPNTDPFPKLIVVWSVATLRATIEWWNESGQPGPLRAALEDAFSVLAEGVAAHARNGAT
jgi:AcrR family transcriptional regulator